MRLRTNPVSVENYKLRRTDRNCPLCEEGTLLKNGHELICEDCQHTPTSPTRDRSTEWDTHDRQIRERSAGVRDGRPRLVGGYKDAYWGEGAYEYNPIDGFRISD